MTSMINNNSDAADSKARIERLNSNDLPGAVPGRTMDSPTIEHTRGLDEIDRGINSQQRLEKAAESHKEVSYYTPLYYPCLIVGVLV